MNRKYLCKLVSSLLLVAITALAAGAAPGLINYQGRLANSSGTPVDGQVDMEFGFYDAPTGGTLLALSQAIADVQVTDGVFNVLIKADQKIFQDPKIAVYLSVTVRGQELLPRQQIVTVPYAFCAERADDADRLDGLHRSDLDSRYVNASGDTMTGPLDVNASLSCTDLTVDWDATVDRILYVAPDGIGGILVGDVEQFAANEDVAVGYCLRADSSLHLGSSKHGGDIHARDIGGDPVLEFDAAGATLNVGGREGISGKAGTVNLKNSLGTDSITLAGSDGDATFEGTVTANEGLVGQGVTGADYLPPLASFPAVPGVKGLGTAGGAGHPGAPAVEAVGGGGTFLGQWDLAFRSYGYLHLFNHDGKGVYALPGNGSTTYALKVGTYGSTGSTWPLAYFDGDVELGGNLKTHPNYGLKLKTGDGSTWSLNGHPDPGSRQLRFVGPSSGEFVIDADNAVIRLGGSTADTVEIPAVIEADSTTVNTAAVRAENVNPDGIAITGRVTSTDTCVVFINKGAGDIIRGFSGSTGGDLVFRVLNSGRVVCTALQITGGGDLAEPFDATAAEEIKPGMVVSIDPDRPGQLRVSDQAYDRKVAGIVSGANGIKPGLTMQQEKSAADGTLPVALTGRVYCWCDASAAPIEPGDLLTTADTSGHAMKVTDYQRAQGAILGKAMTSLRSGRGLVLVLVRPQ